MLELLSGQFLSDECFHEGAHSAGWGQANAHIKETRCLLVKLQRNCWVERLT
jgi:hypothetical protein